MTGLKVAIIVAFFLAVWAICYCVQEIFQGIQ
jgi:hypothetical protein